MVDCLEPYQERKGAGDMIPYLTKGQLNRMPEKRRKKICQCQRPCQYFFNISTENDDVILCETDAKQFVYELLQLLGMADEQKIDFPQSKRGWTFAQENFVLKFLKEEKCMKENGFMKDGTYNMLSEMLGKTKAQIKDKVYHFRKAGRL